MYVVNKLTNYSIIAIQISAVVVYKAALLVYDTKKGTHNGARTL